MQHGDLERIGVADARQIVSAGRALLVCAYDDARCERVRLEGSIPLSQLERQAGTLPKDQQLIFFCA